MGEFWCPAEPQVDPQLIAPHLAPGYKPKAIAALAETGYSILTRSLVVYQSLATWPIAPCYQLPKSTPALLEMLLPPKFQIYHLRSGRCATAKL
ncbi:hypothetical protein PGTUg99_032740 [Puccinia graminis f. sp. tritici]|uniref:Uncharacterized protein n=1 Tax=Puccinia graminis f. sp. tritici TaxID=56615 RepID=A0A5B0S239_PUCGR|nr:hypothetical protein PGTUg99_032740 [Puccinia graminis f. sp. tritici]